MRSSSLVTISLPPTLAKASEKAAQKYHMTRSELFRSALRNFLEEQQATEALRTYQQEKPSGKLKTLKGSPAKSAR